MKPVARADTAIMLVIVAVVLGCASRKSVAEEPGALTEQSKTAAAPSGVPSGAPPGAGASTLSGEWLGKTAKGFALPDAEGTVIDVGKVLGARPVVLVFYRGVW